MLPDGLSGESAQAGAASSITAKTIAHRMSCSAQALSAPAARPPIRASGGIDLGQCARHLLMACFPLSMEGCAMTSLPHPVESARLDAAQAAVERAAHSLRDLRVAEVAAQDGVIENGKVGAYRTKVKLSFKYEGKD